MAQILLLIGMLEMASESKKPHYMKARMAAAAAPLLRHHLARARVARAAVSARGGT